MSSSFAIILVGIIISIIFYEITNISPGGIIVPGMLVLYFDQPERIIYTVVIAILTFYLVKILSKYIIIFGKRRFALMIILSVGLGFLLELILNITSISLISNISIVGYTIAGLIANDLYKQGIKRTIPSLIICTSIVEILVIISNQLGL